MKLSTTAAIPDQERIGREEAAAANPGRGGLRTQAILDAAVELIAEVGYDRMTMGAIAARAKASKATMYRRWPDKAQLVAEAFRCNECAEVSCPPDTGSLRGDLLATVDVLADSLSGDAGLRLAGLIVAMRTDPALAALIRAQLEDDGREITATLISRARSRGEVVAAVDSYFVFSLAPAAILTTSLLLGRPTGGAFRRQLVDEVLLPLMTGKTASTD